MKKMVLFILFFSLLALAGCGYRFLGGKGPDSGISSALIFAPQWENLSGELGLESLLHDALFDWFTESGLLTITTNSGKEADYILSGQILSVEHPGASYGSFDRVTDLKAILQVSYSVKNRQTGAIVLSQPLLLKEKTYKLGNNAVQTLGTRNEALAVMSEEIAEEIYFHLMNLLSSDITEESPVPVRPAEEVPETFQ